MWMVTQVLGVYVNKVCDGHVKCDGLRGVKIKKCANNHDYMHVKNINDHNSKIQNKQINKHKI